MRRSTTLFVLLFALLAAAPVARGTVPLRSPSGATCERPTPFPAFGKAGAWRRSRSRRVVMAPGGARHRAQDVVALEGGAVRAVGKFAYGAIDDDLEGEIVQLYVHLDAPCGPWRQVASATTTRDGERRTLWGVQDDGGRAFVEIPSRFRLPVGVHPARFLVAGDGTAADFTITVVAEGTRAVVFDIDGTLTTGDGEVLRQVLGGLTGERYAPQMQKGARAVVQRWADKGYLPVYLTGRPDVLQAGSLAWLQEQGFPPGPLHLAEGARQTLPTDGGVARYKADFLVRLRLEAGLRFAAAYGNATTDITAYANAGLPKEQTWIVGEHGGEHGTRAVIDYRILAEDLKRLPPAKPPAPRGRW